MRHIHDKDTQYDLTRETYSQTTIATKERHVGELDSDQAKASKSNYHCTVGERVSPSKRIYELKEKQGMYRGRRDRHKCTQDENKMRILSQPAEDLYDYCSCLEYKVQNLERERKEDAGERQRHRRVVRYMHMQLALRFHSTGPFLLDI